MRRKRSMYYQIIRKGVLLSYCDIPTSDMKWNGCSYWYYKDKMYICNKYTKEVSETEIINHEVLMQTVRERIKNPLTYYL